MTHRLSLLDAAACSELIEECSDNWDDPVGWQDHLTSGAARIIGGCGAVFGITRVCTPRLILNPQAEEEMRNALLCHRAAPDVRETHIARDTDAGLRNRFAEYVEDGGFGLLPEINVVVQALLEKGALSYRQSALVDRRTYYRSPIYVVYLREHRIEDMVSAVRRRSDGLVVGLSVMRETGDRTFSARDRAILALLALGAARRLGTRLTTREHLGRHSLSPRLRETLEALLDGASEKEIAYRLDISPATAHEYIAALYRRFDVRSRAELMARYVRRRALPAD